MQSWNICYHAYLVRRSIAQVLPGTFNNTDANTAHEVPQKCLLITCEIYFVYLLY